ncbi:MAG: hypothetical protein WD333_11895 [Dehalococcoidia bacterium]
MEENEHVLSQEEIDALLVSAETDDETAPVEPSADAAGQQPDAEQASDDDGEASTEEVPEGDAGDIAGEPMNPAPAKAQEDKTGEVAALSQGLGKALARINALEKKMDILKDKLKGTATGLPRKLPERLSILEQGSAASPTFNLYHKFTCASCETSGAVQERVRCGNCGKEGWFGRKSSE